MTHEHGPYTLVSIINGNGILTVDDQQYSLHKGNHFIIPATIKSWTMNDEFLAIASEPTD
ncbi:mannose-6-phosphate isomerase [Limosilactobacillus reuteri]|uniref:Phosphohexomutase n=1 Tax=Limosilactobacillus reuteri TaxID=1598 RepID=A0A2S1ET68_LIMRT|nr:mannose-6-phosphate isomerase [Limosilactobacillus reuteri]